MPAGNRRILDLHHRLVEFGVEGPAERFDARDAMAFQHRLQLALGGLHAHDHVAQRRVDRVGIVGQHREGPAQIVGNRQDVLGKTLDPELALAFDVLLGAAAHVLRLGQSAQELVLQLGLLGLQLLHFGRHAFRLGRNIEVGVGRLDRHLSRGAARGWIAGHTLSLV